MSTYDFIKDLPAGTVVSNVDRRWVVTDCPLNGRSLFENECISFAEHTCKIITITNLVIVKTKTNTSPIITGFRDVDVIKGPNGTFEQALEFAKANGTRLFTKAEAMCLYETSESFRRIAGDCKFWVLDSVSVNAPPPPIDYAWYFNGHSGFVFYDYRYNNYGVWCVGEEIR